MQPGRTTSARPTTDPLRGTSSYRVITRTHYSPTGTTGFKFQPESVCLGAWGPSGVSQFALEAMTSPPAASGSFSQLGTLRLQERGHDDVFIPTGWPRYNAIA